jgi:hypothetical protein
VEAIMACNTILTRKTIFAALFAIGAAGSAQAQGIGNVVGGGSATITGGGDNAQITYSMGGAGGGGGSVVQSGRLAAFAGTDGDSPRFNYGAPPDGNPGREAWMIGGGDDTQVLYLSPR